MAATTNRVIARKLVILGESAVGKSSIVLRFVKSQFSEYQEATIGAAYLTQTLKLKDPPITVKFEIWDTAGQERYHSLAPMYYRGAEAAIVVYDITNYNSFQRAKSWVDELNKQATTTKVIALAGNKCDLNAQRAVQIEDAQAYADQMDLIFMETSAKVATNILELFELIATRLPHDTEPTRPTGQQLNPGDSSSPKRTCCR